MFFFLNLLSFLHITNDVCYSNWASLWLSGKNLPAMQETQVRALGEEDPLEKEMVTHSSILFLGNPMDRGAWWVTGHGWQKGHTGLSD